MLEEFNKININKIFRINFYLKYKEKIIKKFNQWNKQ